MIALRNVTKRRSIYDIPRKHMAQRIELGLVLLRGKAAMSSQGSGSFTMTTARPRSRTKFT
jgi:hypothetical protein